MSVSARITLGFTLVLLLHICIAVFAHIGQKRAEDDLQTHRLLRQVMLDSSRLDTSVEELQRSVLSFVLTGNRSTVVRIADLHNTVEHQLDALEENVSDLDREEYVQKMHGHLGQHRELFDSVERERGRRDQIYDESLVPAYQRILQIIATLTPHVSNNDAIDLARCETLAQEAQVATLSYLRLPDANQVDIAKSRIRDIDLATERLGFDRLPATSSVSKKLDISLQNYEKSLIDIVQATRTYLYLVNVAMAGEAAEFLRHSNQFNKLIAESSESLSRDMDASMQRFAQISGTIAVTTILLGIISGIWISRTIAPPLKAITNTLKRLADGSTTDRIPFLNRRDEIGELAAAAQVFRQRSEQIEKLLEQTRKSEEELRAHEEILRRRNAELDEFTYVASHDLQEPLRKLQAFSKLLPMDLGGDLPEDAAKDLKFITDAANRMEHLVDDLLELSRSGRGETHMEPVCLQSCIDEALTTMSMRIEETQATINCCDMKTVYGDSRLLTQLFQNLIGNALKYRAENRRPIIEISAQGTAEECMVIVRDNGIGMEQQYLEQIFSPFKRLHGRAEYEGSGIGLAICRKVVERHGGRIWAESKPGQWSEFRFTLACSEETKSWNKNAQDRQMCY